MVLTIDAGSHRPEHGHAIPWPKVHREVRRLQARIVKAVSRVPAKEALKMLEPLVGKLAWAVLRGLGSGNRPWLPYTLISPFIFPCLWI